MAGGEQDGREGRLGRPLPLSDEPPQPLAQGFPEEQPQLVPPHRGDEQEEDGEEEESERSEVQPRALRLFGEGVVLVRELPFPPVIAQCRGSEWGHQVIWAVSSHLSFWPCLGSLPSPWCPGYFWILLLSHRINRLRKNFQDCQYQPLTQHCEISWPYKIKDKVARVWPN